MRHLCSKGKDHSPGPATDSTEISQEIGTSFGNYLDDTWIFTWKNPEGTALHRRISHELFDLIEKKSYFSNCEGADSNKNP